MTVCLMIWPMAPLNKMQALRCTGVVECFSAFFTAGFKAGLGYVLPVPVRPALSKAVPNEDTLQNLVG